MSTKTAIFDLDGTLLNTLSDIADCLNAALAAYGLPARSVPDCRYLVGRGAVNLVRAACPAGTDEQQVARVYARYTENYRTGYLVKTRAYDGARELLSGLSRDGVRLAVLSNKPHDITVRMISGCFPDIRFAAVLGQREGVPLKPSPEAVAEVLRLTGGDAARTFYLGDSDVDMQTAVNAGLYGCGALWGFRDEPELHGAGARALADSPADALRIARDFFTSLPA